MAGFLVSSFKYCRMTDETNTQLYRHIIFCNCGGERIRPGLLSGIGEYLKNSPAKVTVLSDLCGVTAKRKEALSDLFNAGEEYLILGCYPRTMNLLLDQINEQEWKSAKVKHVNLLELSSEEEAIGEINGFIDGHDGTASHNEIIENSGWPSWYPVIDYSRCTSCGQCADFCLFGVYDKSETRINVNNPAGCKINCPACARICPLTAIIFPKYKNGGAIGGSDEIDEQAEHLRQAIDIESLLGSNIYNAIEKRKIKRQSIIREEAMKKALTERDNALNDNEI